MNTKFFVALVAVTSLAILGVSACATEPEVASVVEDTPMEAPGALASSVGEPTGPHTSTEWQIWAYSTAAPSFVGENATILDADSNVSVSYTHLTLPTILLV